MFAAKIPSTLQSLCAHLVLSQKAILDKVVSSQQLDSRSQLRLLSDVIMVAFAVHSSPSLLFQISRESSSRQLASCKPFYGPARLYIHRNRTTQFQSQQNTNITLSLSRDRAILSIDVGTSATKAALCFIDQQGQLGTLARVAHETHTPADLQIIQCVNDWVEGAIDASRQALSDAPRDVDICAIAISGTCVKPLRAHCSVPPFTCCRQPRSAPA